MTDIRVTREAIEVLSDVDTAPIIRVTRAAVEVLSIVDTDPSIQATRMSAEVLHTTAVAASGPTRRTIVNITYGPL